MRLWRGLRARARAIIASRQADRDLKDEIAFHLERETEKNITLGMVPEEARRAALLSFGGAMQVVPSCLLCSSSCRLTIRRPWRS